MTESIETLRIEHRKLIDKQERAEKRLTSVQRDLADAERGEAVMAKRRMIEAALAEGQTPAAVRHELNLSQHEFETYAPRVGG
ncbi:hypothetical protein [Methylocystis sp.]|uniref:hypothetical protein n=1 Tax=Methylocystis sp. TaxID=1911079 RepID=UPI0025FD2843|nr:hypothetical protein [Methylocystis sp.]